MIVFYIETSVYIVNVTVVSGACGSGYIYGYVLLQTYYSYVSLLTVKLACELFWGYS